MIHGPEVQMAFRLLEGRFRIALQIIKIDILDDPVLKNQSVGSIDNQLLSKKGNSTKNGVTRCVQIVSLF